MAGEFALIERLLGQRLGPSPVALPTSSSVTPAADGLLLGPGDDCALIAPPAIGDAWAISTDMLIEGTHFLGTDNPEDLGWKTLAVNLSDLAAMGAQPRYATLAMALSSDDNSQGWIDRFFSGFQQCAAQFGVTLIGGDTTRGTRSFCVTVFGTVSPSRALRRSGAQAGDDIWISGHPGLAALGLQHKLGNITLPDALVASCDQALHHPQPRVALGMALAGLAHSCLDVSDGLLQDLRHITQASDLTAELKQSALPGAPQNVQETLWQACLLGGGDDYELLFSAPASARQTLHTLSQQLDLPLHRIGNMQKGDNQGTIHLINDQGQPIDLTHMRSGFDHFA